MSQRFLFDHSFGNIVFEAMPDYIEWLYSNSKCGTLFGGRSIVNFFYDSFVFGGKGKCGDENNIS